MMQLFLFVCCSVCMIYAGLNLSTTFLIELFSNGLRLLLGLSVSFEGGNDLFEETDLPTGAVDNA